jgi:hypothetical protein
MLVYIETHIHKLVNDVLDDVQAWDVEENNISSGRQS